MKEKTYAYIKVFDKQHQPCEHEHKNMESASKCGSIFVFYVGSGPVKQSMTMFQAYKAGYFKPATVNAEHPPPGSEECFDPVGKIFSDRLCMRMGELGLKIPDLARLLEISQTKVSRWRTGEIEPTMQWIRTIAEQLNCTSDWLLGVQHGLKRKTEPS